MMVTLTSAELARIIGGQVIAGTGEEACCGVVVDSREALKNSLFVALRGEKRDGVEFANEALRAGAKGAMINWSRKNINLKFKDECFVVAVDDTLKALQFLAHYYRVNNNFAVVAVTGSTGKTTTRDFIRSVLAQRFKVAASPKNFNNEIGLPLSLLNLPEGTEIAVLEMAMRRRGEIAELAGIACPYVGVVTSIGLAHYELLGSQDNIARAKAELIEALPAGGVAILPGEDKYCDYLASFSQADVLKFGFDEANHLIAATGVKLYKLARPRFTLLYGSKEIEVRLKHSGSHYVSNALAAAAVGYVFYLTAEEVKKGLEQAELSSMRGQIENYRGIFLIDDTYNANPDSMASALELLDKLVAERKIACLGDMLELGDISEEQHRLLGKKINSLRVDEVVLVGREVEVTKKELARLGYSGKVNHFFEASEAGSYLGDIVQPGDAVLFKASRLIEMEKALQTLRQNLKEKLKNV